MFPAKESKRLNEIELVAIVDRRRESKGEALPSPYQKKLKRIQQSKEGLRYLSVIKLVKQGGFNNIADYFFVHRNTAKAEECMQLMTSPALLRFWFMVLTQQHGLISSSSMPLRPTWPGMHPFKYLLGNRLFILGSLSQGVLIQLTKLQAEAAKKNTNECIVILTFLRTFLPRFVTELKAQTPEEITDPFLTKARLLSDQHIKLAKQYFDLAKPWCFNVYDTILRGVIDYIVQEGQEERRVPDSLLKQAIVLGKEGVRRFTFSGSYFVYAKLCFTIAAYYSQFSAQVIVSHKNVRRSQLPSGQRLAHESSRNLPLATADDFARDDFILHALHALQKARVFHEPKGDYLKRCCFFAKGCLKDSELFLTARGADLSAIEGERAALESGMLKSFIATETVDLLCASVSMQSSLFRL